RARDRDRGPRHRREQGRLRRPDRERTRLLPGIADRPEASRRRAVRRAAPPLPDHEARGGRTQRRRLAAAAARGGGRRAGPGGRGGAYGTQKDGYSSWCRSGGERVGETGWWTYRARHSVAAYRIRGR